MTSNASAVNNNIGRWQDKIEDDIKDRLEQAGEFLAGKMVDKITSGISPPLKPATIKAKGSSTPLIDTAEMIENITHKLDGDDAVEVGVFGEPAFRATVHEFGAPSRNIPERSFVRSSFNENKKGIVNIIKGGP